MSSFISKIKKLLVSDDYIDRTDSADSARQPGSHADGFTRQMVVDSLLQQFIEQLQIEKTSESLLFHTSYVVYLYRRNYDRISPAFHQTAYDAVKVFLREIKKYLADYPDFIPPATQWHFQLVCLNEDTIVDESDSTMATSTLGSDDTIIIRSSIYPIDSYSSDSQQGRVVATMRSVNSMRAVPAALNVMALRGITDIQRDKCSINFDPSNYLGLNLVASTPVFDSFPSPNPSPAPHVDHPASNPAVNPARPKPLGLASIKITDGLFTDGFKQFNSCTMTADHLHIAGRSALPQPGVQIVNIESEQVLNPHIIIVRDSASGSFSLEAKGDVRLNERLLQRNSVCRLPNNSSILINDEISLSFNIL